jgi:hypothetical protein
LERESRLSYINKTDTLLPIIAENMQSGTLVVSDGWTAYGGIRHMAQQSSIDGEIHRIAFVNWNDLP